ncbi:MAG: ATP-binding cassette domain-containing protein [Planctomycetota bacterium]|nr:ATP-binding cassette domain-containing protein [Planctomycetota bacterium]
MIKAENLVQDYGTVRALADVSFHIPRGQVVGLVGPNGAGKTTTMKILTGYLAPTSGRAHIAGHDVVERRLAAQRHIGYLPENAPIYKDMLVQDYLTWMAKLREIPATERMSRLSTVVWACGLDSVLTKPVGHLSKGFRQRTGLAQAMLHDPDILILDEPTSGLDPNQILDIREMIRGLGREKTVILSTHILSEVEATCDRVLMVVAGELHVDETLESFGRGHGVLLRLLGQVDRVTEAVMEVDGVDAVDPVDEDTDSTTVRLHTDARPGLLTELGNLARAKSWTVIELTRLHHDLEDIFKKLKTSPQEVST